MISWLFKCQNFPKARLLVVSFVPIILAVAFGGSVEASCASTSPEQQAADARIIAHRHRRIAGTVGGARNNG